MRKSCDKCGGMEFKLFHTCSSCVSKSEQRITNLRRELSNIKIRAYELGVRDIHDMALKALIKDSKIS